MAISKIEKSSSWYDLYDESGKKYKNTSKITGDMVSVSGNTFVVKRSSWLDTYYNTGKK
jgi:hypothetical protein